MDGTHGATNVRRREWVSPGGRVWRSNGNGWSSGQYLVSKPSDSRIWTMRYTDAASQLARVVGHGRDPLWLMTHVDRYDAEDRE